MSTINNFLFLCEFQKDNHHLELFKNHVLKLKNATEENAWDGDWYLRAFYDNGNKLGSKENDECQIDSIAQSWSALSDCGEKKRSKRALDSAYNRLVDFENKIIKLFDPPFENTVQNPGYIKNYLPGVRENGGQYTHAGIWLMMAFAEIGDSEKVWKLLQILNPINHSHDEKSANLYKLEPYVVAADIYGADPHKGRGGWSWYTGSSGWLYRAILESFIGLKLRGNILSFRPCLPKEWESIKVQYKFGKSNYHITMINALDKISLSIDGQLQSESHIHLIDEEKNYEVILIAPFSKEKEQ
jgi:cellobiose phosphorylase